MKQPNAEEIFHAALAIARASERVVFVRTACGEDEVLAARVETLLRAHESAAGFLPAEPGKPWNVPIEEETGSRIGRYKLLEKIGEGGFGVVYMAEQREPVTRRVALKVIKLGMDTRQVIARFEAERQALAMMDHPNIAKVLDAGATESGRPYFVMELVHGIPITTFCDENALPVRARLGLFLDVCAAIQHAHQKGIIHRDIKPSNVMITLHDEKPVAKVIDFGIAKAIEQRLTEKTLFTNYAQFVGTPAYVSPEQAQMSGLDIDTRSDIYSLGVLFYELLTGGTPLDGRDLVKSGIDEIRRKIREEEPPRPSVRLSTLRGEERSTIAKDRSTDPHRLGTLFRGELDWIVMKALEKDRNRRYETAQGFASDVRRYLEDKPVEAASPGRWYQTRKWIRRHRTACLAGSLVALALVGGVVASVSQAVRATRASHREGTAREEAQEALADARHARELAEREWSRAESLLTDLDMERAEDYLDRGRHDRALASLARALRREPDDPAIAGRLVSALSGVSHLLPIAPPIAHATGVRRASFNRDGSLVLTLTDGGVASLWDGRTLAPIDRFVADGTPVRQALFSPDGRRVATGTEAGIVQIWRVPACEPAGDPFTWEGGLTKLCWSADGRLLIGAGRDGAVHGRDLEDPEWQFALHRSTSAILDLAVDPRGRLMAAGCEDGRVLVWDLESDGAGVRELKHLRKVTHVRFSPDGSQLLTGSHDGRLGLWDTETWAKRFDVPAHRSALTCLSFDPSGTRIASGSWDRTVRVIATATGAPVAPPLPHEDAPECLAFLGEGEFLATGSRDTWVRLWDLARGEECAAPARHGFQVSSLEVSPDGSRILTASQDGQVRVLEGRAGEALPLRVGLKEPVAAARPGRGGGRVLIATSERIVSWNPASGRQEEVAAGFQEPLVAMAVDASRKRAAVCGIRGAVSVVDVGQGAVLGHLDHGAPINSLEISPSGDFLLTAGSRARVWRMDPARGPAVATVHTRVSRAHFSPDGSAIVTSSWDHSARVWDAKAGVALSSPMKHDLPVLDAVFDPTARWIATASRDQTVGVWEARTGRSVLRLPHRHEVERVAFGPDGQILAAASLDHQVTLWRLPDGTPATSRPLRHGGRIEAMAFSRDGRWLATASEDRRARVWSVRDGRLLMAPILHANAVVSVSFAEDDRTLLTASRGGTVYLHDLPVILDPPPAWLPVLAEAVGGLRFSESGQEEPVGSGEFLALKKTILSAGGDGAFDAWARWFLAPPSEREISCRTAVPAREFIGHLLRDGDPASLRTVLRLDPSNAAARAGLRAERDLR